MEKRMPHPTPSRGWRFDAPGTALCVLLFAAAVAIGCGPAGAATTPAEDKAKGPIATQTNPADTDAKSATPSADAGASPTTITGSVTSDTASDTDSRPTTKKSQRSKRAHIQIGDDSFDSFNDALHTAPWVVGLAFLVAGSILLTPVFLLVGIIWYKLRKTRLQNEALIKLAEKGVLPPAQAADTMMSGATPEQAAAAASASTNASSTAPVYQQAVIARRRAVWSDLRKGVILSAVGLSFVFYSMIESGAANWLGLVLMFLGVGYILLWWFEDRHLRSRESGVDVGKG
jgi:hypothetical protein